MKKIIVLILFALFVISCTEMPAYIEVEGLLVSGSYDIYGGHYILEKTGVIYNWIDIQFTEPITNLSVGKKVIYTYEIDYDINPKNQEEIIKHLGYRVRIKGELRIPDKSYLHTNYLRATDDRPEFWRVRTNMSWRLKDSEIIKILD